MNAAARLRLALAAQTVQPCRWCKRTPGGLCGLHSGERIAAEKNSAGPVRLKETK